jgi:hypothetical protein
MKKCGDQQCYIDHEPVSRGIFFGKKNFRRCHFLDLYIADIVAEIHQDKITYDNGNHT